MSRIECTITPEDKATMNELRDALGFRHYNDLLHYICDRYRADALHIIPAFSSVALVEEERERIARIARTEARKETFAVLYEERFITDPNKR